MKYINTLYYNNNNIKDLTFKNIITISAKTIRVINYLEEKKLENINKRRSKKNI